MLRLVLGLIICLMGCLPFAQGQDLNIRCSSTLSNELNLGTGIDENGMLIPPGLNVVDPFWTLTNTPELLFCSEDEKQSVSDKAYVVNFNNFAAATWTNQTEVSAISPINGGLNAVFNCSNVDRDSGNQAADPFIFDRYFCLNESAEVELALTFKGDDRLQLELVNLQTGVVEAISEEYNYRNPAPAAFSFNTALGLQAGTYALRAKYENFGVAAAFSVKGNISVIGDRALLSNSTTSVELQCTSIDTLALDNYYFYPDSALTICVDTDLLPAGSQFVFQWFDENGEPLNSAASDQQNCYTIPRLNEKMVGIYYAVAQSQEGEPCFVLPVEVQTYVQDPTGAWYIPNQLVVRYQQGTSEEQKLDYIKRIQATRLDSCMCLIDLLMLPDTIFNEDGSIIVDPEEKKKKAGEDDNAGVESVGWNTIMEEEALPAGLLRRQSKLLQQQLVKQVSDEEVSNGDSIIVALIDTGFDYQNPDYQNYMWKNPEPYPMSTDSCKACITGAEIGYDFGDRDNDPSDNNMHGTFVGEAIIYAAELLDDLNAPKLKIMPLKVMDDKSTITVFNVTCATVFAVRHGAMVINMSMGGYGGYQDILAAGLATVDSGRCAPIVVTSAGNDTLDNSIFDHYFSNLNDSLLNVVSVGSLEFDREGTLVRAPYSNYGSKVNLAVTGDAEFDTTPSTGVKGTSISAGYVSGILAYIYEQKPGISWSSAKDCLLSAAEGRGATDFPLNRGLDLTGQDIGTWKGAILEHLFTLPDESCTYTNQVCFPLVVSTKDKRLPRAALAVKVVPNPTNASVRFELTIEQAQTLKFQIFDVQGKLIDLFERELGSGAHQIPFNFAEQPSGIYFYTIISEKYIQSGKIVKQR